MNTHILCLTLALLFTLHAQAGVVIGGTRFIYPEDASSISVNIKNTASTSYLVQSKISSYDGKTLFIATPPIFSINGGHANKVRIIRLGGNLPADRESLFYLTVAAIPEGKPEANSLQIAVKSRMKLFYRPAALNKGADVAYQKLQWGMNQGVLQVKNATPYYVTLSQLKINQQPVEQPNMVAPFGSLTFSACNKNTPCEVQWQSLNDYAVLMPACHITLAGSTTGLASCLTKP